RHCEFASANVANPYVLNSHCHDISEAEVSVFICIFLCKEEKLRLLRRFVPYNDTKERAKNCKR
ncbi:MAG: hypothetical protein LBS73_02745, partial [Campylobacteraceae bacterium]|nr:hypothetical protein [Campylobacteraceae bacterium]